MATRRKAFTMSIEIDGLKDMERQLSRAPAKVLRELDQASENAVRLIAQKARQNVSGAGTATKLGERTGGFKRRIRWRREGFARHAVGSSHPAARIHELGGKTKPHEIRPRRAEALHFVIGGKDVFAKVVHHPGSKMPKRPWLAPAVRESEREVNREFRYALQRGLRRAGFSDGRGPKGGYKLTGTASREVFEHSAEVESAAGALANLLGRG